MARRTTGNRMEVFSPPSFGERLKKKLGLAPKYVCVCSNVCARESLTARRTRGGDAGPLRSLRGTGCARRCGRGAGSWEAEPPPPGLPPRPLLPPPAAAAAAAAAGERSRGQAGPHSSPASARAPP